MNIQSKSCANKRTAVLNSTLKLVRKHGFHGCPMSQIAEDAGVAAGTIYHYFESKDQLIIALFNQVKGAIYEAVFECDNAALPFKERFFSIWDRYFDFMVNNPDMLYFLEQYMCSPYGKKDPENQSVKLKTKFADFFASGIQQKEIKDLPAFVIAPVVFGSLVSLAKTHLSGKQKFNKTDIEQTAHIIWDGLKTPQA